MWLEALVAAIWFTIGWSAFVHDWTKKYDYTHDEIFTSCLAGLMGPISWGILFITGPSPEAETKTVLIPKKEAKHETKI